MLGLAINKTLNHDQDRNLTRILIAFSMPIVVLVLFTPQVATAQTGLENDLRPRAAFSPQKSVLVQSADSNPRLSSGANGTASVEPERDRATFRPQKFSSAPEAPKDLLMPSADEQTFNRPLANELRSESVSTQVNSEGANDGSQAIGTHATTNPKRQDQSVPGSQFRGGFLGGTNFGPQVDPSGFGPGQENSSRLNSLPPITSRAQAATQASPLNNTLRRNGAQISDQPSPWRNAPATEDQSSAQPFNMSANPIGQSARSSLNQPMQSPSTQNVQNTYNAQPPERFALRDESVRPTGFTQPIPQPTLTTDLAKTLIARYAVENVSGGLPGQPVKMIDMLRQPISNQQRRPMVSQYWLTYYDWANLVSAQQYQQWLTRIPASASGADKAMLDAAVAVAENKVLAAEIQLGKSQSQLRQFMSYQQSDLLPLPDDLPLIQKYRTNYEAYKSRQMLPVSLLGIDQMLPRTLELIMKRAEAVRISKVASNQVLSAMSTRQTSIATVLEAGRIWRAAEQDLVATVVDYNQAIGDYSLSVSHGYQTPEQVVAMLIAKPKSPPANIASANMAPTTPASNRPQVQFPAANQSQFGGSVPSTARGVDPSRLLNQATQEQSRQNFGGQGGGFGASPPAGNPNTANAQSSFGLGAREFQSNGGGVGGQNGTNRVAPAASMGGFAPIIRSQPTGQGNVRAAQSPFGPGVQK